MAVVDFEERVPGDHALAGIDEDPVDDAGDVRADGDVFRASLDESDAATRSENGDSAAARAPPSVRAGAGAARRTPLEGARRRAMMGRRCFSWLVHSEWFIELSSSCV